MHASRNATEHTMLPRKMDPHGSAVRTTYAQDVKEKGQVAGKQVGLACKTPSCFSVAFLAASRRVHMTLASSLLIALSSSASASIASRAARCLST